MVDELNIMQGLVSSTCTIQLHFIKKILRLQLSFSLFSESDYNGEDMNSHHLPPPPKHFTVAYLDPNTSGKCDYDDFDYADESIDPYQTLRSNGSMKSVKIAPEVTEFHYTKQGKSNVISFDF